MDQYDSGHIFGHMAQFSHCVSEAVVSVDVSGAGGQFDPVTHTDATPLGRGELRSRDTVHLPCFVAFIDQRLLAEPQPAVILTTNTNSFLLTNT